MRIIHAVLEVVTAVHSCGYIELCLLGYSAV
jgi:hypothetical protein